MNRRDLKGLSADTNRLLAGQESREVDFKLKSAAVKPEDIVAFANGQGGTILVGVDETQEAIGTQRAEVVGCDVSDESRQGIISTAASCRPIVDVTVRVENSGGSRPIFRIDVPEGAEKPYGTSSGTYKIRADGQNVGIDPHLMKAMILEAESEEFLNRFRAAADHVVKELRETRSSLSFQIDRVEAVADAAEAAASEARDAAYDAASAASDAAAAAEDASD